MHMHTHPIHSWDDVPFEPQFLVLADLRPLTQSAASDADVLLEAEALRYACKAWLREEGFYDVKVCMSLPTANAIEVSDMRWDGSAATSLRRWLTHRACFVNIEQVSIYSTSPDALTAAWQPQPPPSEKATQACSVTHHFKVSHPRTSKKLAHSYDFD